MRMSYIVVLILYIAYQKAYLYATLQSNTNLYLVINLILKYVTKICISFFRKIMHL